MPPRNVLASIVFLGGIWWLKMSTIIRELFKDVRSMDMEPHLNTSFKHFIFFAQEFQILPQSEMEPLQPCIDVLTRK